MTIALALFNKLIADWNPHPSRNSTVMTHLNLSVIYVTGVVFGQCKSVSTSYGTSYDSEAFVRRQRPFEETEHSDGNWSVVFDGTGFSQRVHGQFNLLPDGPYHDAHRQQF